MSKSTNRGTHTHTHTQLCQIWLVDRCRLIDGEKFIRRLSCAWAGVPYSRITHIRRVLAGVLSVNNNETERAHESRLSVTPFYKACHLSGNGWLMMRRRLIIRVAPTYPLIGIIDVCFYLVVIIEKVRGLSTSGRAPDQIFPSKLSGVFIFVNGPFHRPAFHRRKIWKWVLTIFTWESVSRLSIATVRTYGVYKSALRRVFNGCIPGLNKRKRPVGDFYFVYTA